MFFLENIPEANQYIEKVDKILISKYRKKGLSKKQKKFLSFCITAIIMTESICWEAFQKVSIGSWKAKALSFFFRKSKIPWDHIFHASVSLIIKIFNIKEAILVIDDLDRERSKSTKTLFGVHKTRSKRGGGFTFAQNIVFLVIVTKKITLPVGFYFYRPDPKMKEWKVKDEKLRKKGTPKRLRPKKPKYQKDYPPKKAIGMKLLRSFAYWHGDVTPKAITADSAYLSKQMGADCQRVFPKAPLISQLRRNLRIIQKKGKGPTIDEYFRYSTFRTVEMKIRGVRVKTVSYKSADLFIKSLGRKVRVVAIRYENEKKNRYICCSDLTWRPQDIIFGYSFRWLVDNGHPQDHCTQFFCVYSQQVPLFLSS